MTMTFARAVLCAVLMTVAGSAHAASNVCTFRAYSDDTDPQGTNVRSGPGKGFPIAGVLKSNAGDDGTFSPEFDVRRFKDGWVEIGDATIGQYGDGPEQVLFEGPGWVSARLIRFEIEDPVLREAPGMAAKTVQHLGYVEGAANPWALDQVKVETIHGCEGPFIDVTLVNARGETARGWATDICENQATTCS
ncbi:SH3 domain-containing protein [Devosia sp. A16]|uniref:SH3 domain-containing protein n=1 Tax=Devosia sp. A16 TaxID=1736675 RepID=UPI000A40B943|nr:hypothetical protein [Devosia sp. A16]